MKKRCSIIAAAILSVFFITDLSFAEMAYKTLERVDEYEWIPVKVVKKIRLPGGYHEGLYAEGGDIWVSNGRKGQTWVVDPSTGKIKSTIRSIATFTEAISAAGDGTYYVTDWDMMRLYRAERSGDKLVAKKSLSFEPSHPAGVIWTGDKLYVITWTRGVGTKFHLLEFDNSGNMASQILIKCIQEPSQLAWDGRYLWITSWYSRLVYKVDIDTWKAVGVFASPVSDATGIVWVGDDLWITGTHGDLYQLKVGSR
jgi:glutamine cyclotransferase